jgi:hypothetical protein
MLIKTNFNWILLIVIGIYYVYRRKIIMHSNFNIIDDDEVINIGDNHRVATNENSPRQNPRYEEPMIDLSTNYQFGQYQPTITEQPRTPIAVDSTSIRFVNGFYAIVGGAMPIVRRHYDMDYTGDVYDRVCETIDSNKGFSEDNVSKIVGALIRPSVDNYRTINISGGMQNKRLIYMLMFEKYNGITNRVTTYYLNGYADKIDMSYTGKLNPDTKLYVNEIVEVERGYRIDGRGNKIPFQRLISCDQLITGNYELSNIDNMDCTIRPYDIFRSKKEDVICENHRLNRRNTISDSFIFNNSNRYKKSSRINNNPNEYVSKSLKALDTASGERDVYSDLDYYDTAAERVYENSVTYDGVLATLSRRCEIRKDGFFKLEDLYAQFPNTTDPTLFSNATMPDATYEIESVDLTSRLYEVQIGTALAQAVPALAVKHYLTNLHFTVIPKYSPIYGLGELPYIVQPISARGYLPHEFTMTKWQHFVRELTESVLPSIIPDPDNISVEFELSMNIVDKTHIDIRINGGEWYPQVYPNFCDGLMTPIVAPGHDALANATESIVRAYEDFYGHHHFN